VCASAGCPRQAHNSSVLARQNAGVGPLCRLDDAADCELGTLTNALLQVERAEEELKEKLAAHRQEKAKPVRLTDIQHHAAKQREMQKEHRAARAAASHDAQIQELKAQVRCPSPCGCLRTVRTLDELKSSRARSVMI